MAALPCVLDVEASGLGSGSYPIEVGVALPDGAGLCRLVQPRPEWKHWDDRAQALHGIDRDTLRRHGAPAAAVAEELNRALAGGTVYSDAWGNDYSWLNMLFDAAGLLPRFRLESLRTLLDDAQAARWHATREAVARELALTRHRASTDARILQLALQRVRGSDARA